jgi:hypothetical protein
LGYADPVDGTFNVNLAQVAAFDVLDATGTNQLGTALLVMAAPESGTFNPLNGLAAIQTAGPAPASMLLYNSTNGFAQAGDVWVSSYHIIIIPWCPQCPCEGGCPPPGPTNSIFATNNATNPSQSMWTIIAPSMLGSETFTANLTGSFNITATNSTPPASAPVSTNAVPIALTSLNLVAAPSDDPTNKIQAVDTAGLFGPAGGTIYLGPIQFQLLQNAGLSNANVGNFDPVAGTLTMNWGFVGNFSIYNSNGSQLVGSGQLLTVAPQTGVFNETTGYGTNETTGQVPATMVLYNTGGDAPPSISSLLTVYFLPSIPFVIGPNPCEGICPGCDSDCPGGQPTSIGDPFQSQIIIQAETGELNMLATLKAEGGFGVQELLSGSTLGEDDIQTMSLGLGTLTQTGTGFTLGNLGSSGQDGMQIAINPGQGFALEWADLDPSNSLPVGAYLEEDLFGTGGTVTNGLLGVIHVIKQSSTNYIGTANFSPMGATNITTAFLYQGQTEDSYDDLCGCIFSSSLLPTDFEPPPRGGPSQLTYKNVFAGNGHGPVYDSIDAISIGPENPPPMVLTSVTLRASGIPYIVITSENQTVTYGGLVNTAEGNATLAVTNNMLIVGNLGTNGQDGVQFAPGPEGFAFNWQDFDPSNSLPAGASLTEELFGTGGTVTNGLLGTVQVIKENGTNYSYTADFSPMGSTNMDVQVLYEGTPELAAVEINGVVCRTTIWPSDFEYAMNTGEIYGTYGHVFSAGLNPGVEYVTADEVGIVPLKWSGLPERMEVTSVELLASGIPQIIITNESLSLLYAGTTHASLGDATLTILSNQLTISNLGSSGQDGVEIWIPPVTNWGAQWEPLDPSNSLPVGAWLQMQEFGTGGSVTNGVLGTITVKKTGVSNSVVCADYTAIGVTNFTVLCFNGTNQTLSLSNLPTGTLFYAYSDPAVSPSPGSVISDVRQWSGQIPLSWRIRALVSLDASGTNAVPATYAVIIPQHTTFTNLPSAVIIRASQIPAIVVTNETVAPLILTSTLTGTNLQFQWYGTGVLQDSTNLHSWADFINSTSPYVLSIGPSNQFFRIRQQIGSDGDF